MVKHTNFYETINEARMRLRNTIVMYKNTPYYVVDVVSHEDGRFRVYMDALGRGAVGYPLHAQNGFPDIDDYYPDGIAEKYDKFIEQNPDSGFVRKVATSRHFNKFRPFPLGNVNVDGMVIYTERSPTRNMHQGLLEEAVLATIVTTAPQRERPERGLSRPTISRFSNSFGTASVNRFSPEFADMLSGNYPTYQEVVDNLRDPAVINQGCAFDREWSLLRGPIDILCLCYKEQGVGIVDNDDVLHLSDEYRFLYETIEELGNFKEIQFKKVRS